MTWRDIFRAVLSLTYGICVVAILVFFAGYGSDVIYRNSAEHWFKEVSDVDGGLYTARYSYLGRGWILLRIYKTGDAKILAERTYQYGDTAKLVWTDDAVVYDTSENGILHDGAISLPPTWLDGVLAKIP